MDWHIFIAFWKEGYDFKAFSKSTPGGAAAPRGGVVFQNSVKMNTLDTHVLILMTHHGQGETIHEFLILCSWGNALQLRASMPFRAE